MPKPIAGMMPRLISAILFTGMAAGTFSFADFYTRRVKRIFPALLVVLAWCLLAGWLAFAEGRVYSDTLRLLGNASLLRFNDTEVLGVLRNQQPPDKSIGTDLSAGLQYRPLYSQNIVITGSVAALLPGRGLRELYDVDGSVPLYSALLNVILAY